MSPSRSASFSGAVLMAFVGGVTCASLSCSGDGATTSAAGTGGAGTTSTAASATGQAATTGAMANGATVTGAGPTGAGTTGAGTTTGSGPVSCATPSNAYAMNGGTCGTFRWAVKTGTDNDVASVNLTPQVTTIPALVSLPTTAGGYCTRIQPERQTYELRDVSLKFERMEADSDYHLIATDPQTGKTMLVEVPYPGCVGHNHCQNAAPFLCDITHARAAVDQKNPGAQSYVNLGTGTVIGVGFFDTDELMNTPMPTGMAPNGIELHPVLAICFGQGCNPLQGY